ncbi:MAG TPA: hypothetical protein VFV32_08360 [Acidimicrobiales bacterium]|nr:hypothetical protein [Acidimicrobiales bacterium]
MQINRKLAGAAAFAFALAGGGVAGAVLNTPDGSSATTEAAGTATASALADLGPGGHGGEMLATAADALGMSEADLRTALEGGQSIAQVAEAQGVDVQVVIDALVAQATEHLNELEASLPDRMTALVNREGWGQGPGGRGPGHHAFEVGLDVAADTIGISEADLMTALRSGDTIAEVAQANGVEPQAVIDALVAKANERIDAAVAAGDLDAARAEELKSTLTDRITQRVNEGGPMDGPMGGPGHHRGGPFHEGASSDAAA